MKITSLNILLFYFHFFPSFYFLSWGKSEHIKIFSDIFEDEEVPDSPPSPELEQCPEEMECDDVIPCTPLPKLKPGRKQMKVDW